jgi:hypothetical protein
MGTHPRSQRCSSIGAPGLRSTGPICHLSQHVLSWEHLMSNVHNRHSLGLASVSATSDKKYITPAVSIPMPHKSKVWFTGQPCMPHVVTHACPPQASTAEGGGPKWACWGASIGGHACKSADSAEGMERVSRGDNAYTTVDNQVPVRRQHSCEIRGNAPGPRALAHLNRRGHVCITWLPVACRPLTVLQLPQRPYCSTACEWASARRWHGVDHRGTH